MTWAEGELKEHGHLPARAVWLPPAEDDLHVPQPCFAEPVEDTIQAQEAELTEGLKARWRDGRVTAAAMVAPVLFGKAGTAERTEAVRLHIEALSGYCADILMPYRVRPAPRWRRKQQNRVHFSHPVAQESIPRLCGPPTQNKTFGIDHADQT
ncbi:MAG: hypothetical protein JWM54_1095 [Acidobacteriaceae bacterium]|nr:hypothetical protein [Acidobacteriaceae bacterium]